MSATWAFLAVILAVGEPAFAAFEQGGLIETSPRSAALAGSDFALSAGVASDCAAALAGLPGPDSFGSMAAATRAGLTAVQVRAGTPVEGLGLGVGFHDLSAGAASERSLTAGIGMPIQEVPGLSVGAAVRFLRADFAGDRGSGVGLDLSVRGPVRVGIPGVEIEGAAGIDNAFAGLEWESGNREDLTRQGRAGLRAGIDRALDFLAEARIVGGGALSEDIWAFGIEHALHVRGVAGALRIGWREGTRRTGTLSAGLGATWGPATIDYAIVGATASQGYLHLASLRWRWGPGGPAEGGRVPRAAPVAAAPGAGEAVPESPEFVASSPWRTFRFAVRPPRAGRIEGWSVLVLDAAGDVIWSTEGEGAPPASVEWNGTTQRGQAAPDGRYQVSLAVRGTGGLTRVSTGGWFRLVRPPEPSRGPEPEGEGGY